MTEDELEELLRDCPTLWHMAEAGAWPSIARHGLLSTSALLDLHGVEGAAREAIEARRRPASAILETAGVGRAVVRDNGPLDMAGLGRALVDGTTPEEWLRLLNGRVFFWLTRGRLGRLLGGRLYRDAAHDVLEVDARSLVAAHRGRIELAPINTGATRPFPAPRGRASFAALDAYDYARWRARRPRGERVVELAVPGGVPDIARHVRRVVRMRGDREEALLWTRGAALPFDAGPG